MSNVNFGDFRINCQAKEPTVHSLKWDHMFKVTRSANSVSTETLWQKDTHTKHKNNMALTSFDLGIYEVILSVQNPQIKDDPKHFFVELSDIYY